MFVRRTCPEFYPLYSLRTRSPWEQQIYIIIILDIEFNHYTLQRISQVSAAVLHNHNPKFMAGLVRDLVRNILSVGALASICLHCTGALEETYPVVFSNCPRRVSVTFSLVLRIFAGSVLPPLSLLSAWSRPGLLLASKDCSSLTTIAYPCRRSLRYPRWSSSRRRTCCHHQAWMRDRRSYPY